LLQKASRAPPVSKDLRVRQEWTELPESRDLQARQAVRVQLVLRVQPEFRVLTGQLASRVQQVPPAPTEPTALRVLKENRGFKALKVRPVPLVRLAQPVLLARQVHKEQLVTQVQQVQQVLQVQPAVAVPQMVTPQELQVQQALQVQQVQPVSKVQSVQPVLQGQAEPTELKALKVKLVQQVLRVRPE